MAEQAYDAYLRSHPGLNPSATTADFDRTARDYGLIYDGLLPGDKTAPSLDLGCGQGYFLYYLRSRGYANLTGIDVSPQQVEFARGLGFEVHCGDASVVLPRRGHFQLISLLDVLEHIPKPRVVPLLTEVRESLRPGGLCLVQVPNMENPFNINTRFGDFTHEGGFTSGSLTQVLRLAGFGAVEVRPYAVANQRLYKRALRWAVAEALRRLYEIPRAPSGAHAAIQFSRRIFALAVP